MTGFIITVSPFILAVILLTVFSVPVSAMSVHQSHFMHSGMSIHTHMDKHYIEQMIPHHQDAIEMSKLALQKAEHQEIKTLAQNIITSQTLEIEQMKTWYKAWYGTDVPTEVMEMHHTDLSELENAEKFDKAFIKEMIPHHKMAVMMSKMVITHSEKQELKNLAQNIITTQTYEINQMFTWYKLWYLSF